MRTRSLILAGTLAAFLAPNSPAQVEAPRLAEVFPPPESAGGWKTLLPESGLPDAAAKAEIKAKAGVDWDKLALAWDYNATAPGNTGFVVIRHGLIVGEWYRGGRQSSGPTTSTPARRPTPAPPSA